MEACALGEYAFRRYGILFCVALNIFQIPQRTPITTFRDRIVQWLILASLIAWYIPPDWIKPSDHVPETILEAAYFTAQLVADASHMIPYSNIPLIIHQTWKDTDVDTWQPDIIEGVEQWLTYATAAGNVSMAYFLWLDEGCKQLIKESEPDIVEYVDALPLKVEKSDVFRVLVLNSIGGVVSVWNF